MELSVPSSGNTLGSLRILLLEDSQIDAELIELHLSGALRSFVLQRVDTGLGFEAALDSKPDVVLADYALPGFDGLEALRMTLEVTPDTPFIFVSGVVGEEFATDALLKGASDYITKRNLRRLPNSVFRAVSQARERIERQRAEAALRMSEVSGQLALRASRLGAWDLTPTTGRLVWDLRTREMFGVPVTQPLDLGFFGSMLHPDDRDRVVRAVQRSTSDPRADSFGEQFRIVTPAGEERWIESLGQALFIGNVCTRFVGVVRDITDERQAGELLRARAASLEASVERQQAERDLLWRNSQDLLLIVSPNGIVRDVNPSYDRILGATALSVRGRLLRDLIHPDDAPETVDKLLRLDGHPSERFENRVRHADGSYRWFSWIAGRDDTGIIYVNARHITAEKEASERLAEVEDALRQSQKMEAIGQLTGGIAHDFNNMLAGIIGALDVIQRRLGQGRFEDNDRFIEGARTSAHRAAALTHRLLSFARRQALDLKSVDVNKTIQSVEDLLRRTLGENIALEIAYGDDLPPALTDTNQFENAVLNLAINSRDAMPTGGRLTITTAMARITSSELGGEPGEYVRVSVADTGLGMSPDVIAKAFDPFFTTKPIGQGTGLGLSTIYGFIKQTGGEVILNSRPDQGTTVNLYLKRAHGAVVDGAGLSPAGDLPLGQGEIAMIVEDEAAVRASLVELVSELGYRPIEAIDATTAQQLLDTQPRIDVMISDIGLPGISGRRLADLVRERIPELPVLLVTGYSADAAERINFLGPQMALLTKPFTINSLAAKLRELLGQRAGPAPAAAGRAASAAPSG